jgi:hypothetical protein
MVMPPPMSDVPWVASPKTTVLAEVTNKLYCKAEVPLVSVRVPEYVGDKEAARL